MAPKTSRILKTINELEGYLSKLDTAKQYTLEQFQTDWNKYFAVERLIQLSVECVIEIGEDIISLAGLKKPEVYRETFIILAKEGIISEEISTKLQHLVEFRNKLVHAYSTVSTERIYQLYTTEMPAVSEFIAVARKFLTEKQNP